ncbi:MAG TPA: DUF4870 domain-containing protein [Verrucomicrobiae bacterium]|jgi:hypothetical protein|nr:DUF4870 domain-containing protein [Verrucomicrobiae bacterium]
METPPPLSPPPIGSIPPPAPLPPRGNDKLWSILSHLSALIGVGYLVVPLVVYLVMKNESEYVACNAREALNFHISVLIYALCCIPLVFVVIGIPLMMIVGFGSLILSIVAAVKASEGGCYHYPLTIRLVQ